MTTVKELDRKDFAEKFGVDLWEVLEWLKTASTVDILDIYNPSEVIPMIAKAFEPDHVFSDKTLKDFVGSEYSVDDVFTADNIRTYAVDTWNSPDLLYDDDTLDSYVIQNRRYYLDLLKRTE